MNEEPERSPPRGRLAASIAELTRLVESGDLESLLRKVAMLNPAVHVGRALSVGEAHVVVRLAGSARPVPLARLARREVGLLPRLASAGFVAVEQHVVRITPRGRAFAKVRGRERDANALVLGRLR